MLHPQVVTEFLNDKDGAVRKGLVGMGETKMCEDCGAVFDIQDLQDMVRFRNHRRKHFYANYKCDCPVTWTTPDEKKHHVMQVHLGEKEGYKKCPVEGCPFVGIELIMKTHVEASHTDYACECCGVLVKGKTRLKTHMRHKHPEKLTEAERQDRPFKLKGGRNAFRDPSKRVPRLNRNHCETKVYLSQEGCGPVPPCPDCGKQYDKQKQLYSHYRMVHGEYTCWRCGVKKIGESAIRKHHRLMHPKQQDLPSTCEQCGKRLANGKLLQIHILNLHTDESLLPHPCPKCPRRFSTAARVWSHNKRVHTEGRGYACRYGCGSTYKEGSDRAGHEKKAHGMTYVQFQQQQQQETTDAAAQLGPQWQVVATVAPTGILQG